MNWGILATGNIASKFANTINLMYQENQTLAACASRSTEKASEFAARFSIPKAYGSYEELLTDPSVECIYIATPNNLHYENIKMCLLAGKHVLCEKPFTVTKAEAEELFLLAEEKNLFLMEGVWTYHLPAMKKMQELIQTGVIGDIVYARSDYGFIARGARYARKFDSALAGGALLDIGIYNLAFMRMVMGKENPESFTSRHHINEFGTDDFSTILLEYSAGKTATITTCIGIDMPRNAIVYGKKGSISLKDFQAADQLTVCVDGEEPAIYTYPIEKGGFEYEIREAAKCIAEGKCFSDVVPPSETLALLDTMESIRDSWGMKFACETI